ncbi:T-cell immunoglobulin and mucin domain-containing protein 2-like isoform X2 [Mastomys coucha]|uniref:T-cell immunoglobulin and mucin domain-containing protein 2-like isoform X2 n=1 Tax=Mastomys coucha TaxID=35658 RepID=UPI001262A216|nr:T-cell immunoglobulin and mucin domain-containing protein 2-like isoform X2 [Mastomys coucha]
MIPLHVFISGLILLLPGAVESHTVQGLVGHSVTLPCIYSTHLGGIVPACWGQGECHHSYCIRTLIWTNGYTVTHQRSSRYQLKGSISEGNVSLTIENTVASDAGPYCCVVEIPGAFYYVDYSLEVKPGIPTSPPTRPATTGRPTTVSTRSTHVPTSTGVSTSTPPTSAHTQTHKPETTTFYPDHTTAEVTGTPSYTPADWNYTVTSSDDSWNNNTEAIPPREPEKSLTKGFYVGISIAALLIMILLSTVVIIRYMAMKKKSGSLSHGCQGTNFVDQAALEFRSARLPS